MSFILDALKKSESDRQRQSGPSLFEVKVAPPRRRLPLWAVAIAVLLAINLIVIAWMLLRHPAAPNPATAAESAPSAAAPVVARAAPSASPAAAPAEPASVAAPAADQRSGRQDEATGSGARSRTESPSATAASTPLPNSAPAQPPAGNSPSDYAPAVEPPTTPGSAASADAGTTDGLAIYQQIVNSANLPELHLDLHVYADRPQDRFAMINMHRVTEGDSLPNGVQVAAIRPDGVVLSYHGTRFLLPRD
ncbi:MAG TPA: general secretion pathway protein GspB [Steroidobacteraceae bacterium]|nr:general secretion pathway protein GspB [Steroidobacteraceae bacterium]